MKLFIHNIINAVKSELKWISEDLKALDKSDKAVRLSHCHWSISKAVAVVVNVMAFVQILYYLLPLQQVFIRDVEVIF